MLVTVVLMSRTTKITSLWFYVVIFCFTAFVNAEENKFPEMQLIFGPIHAAFVRSAPNWLGFL